MGRLVVIALVGFAAQLVDGSMGMAYGVTSSTLLIMAGFSPLVASASLHLAEVATTLASGISHRRMGNVNRRMVLALAIPGAIGGFAGALLLGALPGHLIRPVVSAILLLLGCSILYRFSQNRFKNVQRMPRFAGKMLIPLGLFAGVCDVVGGGGWGPIVTTTLLAGSQEPPRTVIGSVSFSETAVAASATVGFLVGTGVSGFSLPFVLALTVGGVLAAPAAAWLVSRVPRQTLGLLVGGVILLTNLRTVLATAGVGGYAAAGLYATAVAATVIAYLRLRWTAPRPTYGEAQPQQPSAPEPYVANLND